MNHRTYDGQRFSPLARITKDNVKNLKLAYAVPPAAAPATSGWKQLRWSRTASLSPTPGACFYKIDVRAGVVGRIVWRMEPSRSGRPPTAAMRCGQFHHFGRQLPARVIATDKETGKVAWETNMVFGQAELFLRPHRCRSRWDRCRRLWRRPRARLDCRADAPPGRCGGASLRSWRPASPAAKPGRATTTPGRLAAAPCG